MDVDHEVAVSRSPSRVQEMMFMSDRPVVIPGPDHPITVEKTPGRVVVTVAGIREHAASYPDRVGSIQVLPAD